MRLQCEPLEVILDSFFYNRKIHQQSKVGITGKTVPTRAAAIKTEPKVDNTLPDDDMNLLACVGLNSQHKPASASSKATRTTGGTSVLKRPAARAAAKKRGARQKPATGKPVKKPHVSKTMPATSAPKTKKAKSNVDLTLKNLTFQRSGDQLGYVHSYVGNAYEKGGSSSYDQVELWTEFTGSTAAERTVESVCAHMDPAPTVTVSSSGDIKPNCRKVALDTGGGSHNMMLHGEGIPQTRNVNNIFFVYDNRE